MPEERLIAESVAEHKPTIIQQEDGEYIITCTGCAYRASAWYAIPALVAAKEIEENTGGHLLLGLPKPRGPMSLIDGQWVEHNDGVEGVPADGPQPWRGVCETTGAAIPLCGCSEHSDGADS